MVSGGGGEGVFEGDADCSHLSDEFAEETEEFDFCRGGSQLFLLNCLDLYFGILYT